MELLSCWVTESEWVGGDVGGFAILFGGWEWVGG